MRDTHTPAPDTPSATSLAGQESLSTEGHWWCLKWQSHLKIPPCHQGLGEAPTHLKFRSLTENLVSMIPVVFTRDRNTSCSLGR